MCWNLLGLKDGLSAGSSPPAVDPTVESVWAVGETRGGRPGGGGRPLGGGGGGGGGRI